MTLDDILGNQELNDDFEITLGDKGAFKLGDLRARNNEYGTLKSERDALASDRDRLRSEYEKQSGTLSQLLEQAGKAAANDTPPPDPRDHFVDSIRKLVAPSDPAAPLFEDKVFGAAFNRIKEEAISAADAKYKTLNDELNGLKSLLENNTKAMANAHLYEREQRWWNDNRNDAPVLESGKKLTLDQLKEYASQNGVYVPGTQFIDYDRALDMINAPIRAKQDLDKAREDAYQQGLMAGRTGKAQVLPLFGDRSGGNGAPSVETKGRSPRVFVKEAIKRGLDELTSSAGNE